ncbi:CubicO group peptidase (beta-lactamase class C family) [Hamadaea flava]|uniref:Serine hydrolase domain-containing protein n=1 Tax=Hamadaea flava TaxID=1742688 RepID=A0ABV8LTQ0_9ACTN|nr:serine hydrolase domain-containing protein [Hamadaea flava]MCP2328285.1 CubicO group peptidase (beta-lactamase class C family) [Hamadaea flava]
MKIALAALLMTLTIAPAPAADLDASVAAMLAEDRIPGAAVVIVERGKPAVIETYGDADVTSHRPVDATTPFLTGSLAKVFTAEAVLRQAASGAVDLTADVNRYLTGFQIDDTYPGRPVTVQNLLTYTAGFDEDLVGLAGDPDDLPSLADSVAARQPERVRPPGTRIAYDNYALALAGRIVETTSGQAYADYVAQHVFAAHGMTGSTAAVPHPAEVAQRLAVGYRPDGDGYAEQRGQYAPWTPSGTGPAVTPSDMAAYLAYQLSGDPIAEQMQRQHVTQDARMPGMGYVLEERPRNGQRVLFKDGDVPGYHNAMALLPDQGFGVYAVVNGDGVDGVGPWAVQRLVNQLIDQRFPGSAAATQSTATDVSGLAGVYRSARTSHTSLMKAAALFAAPTVAANADGTLTTTGLSPDPDRATQTWLPIGPGLFQERDGQARLSFPGDGVLVSSALPSEVYEKLPWYDTPTVNLALFGVGALALVLAALGLPVALAVRRRLAPSRWTRLATLCAWLSGVTTTAFLTGFVLVMSDPNTMGASLALNSWDVAVLPILARISAGFAAPMLPFAVAAWRSRWWGPVGRIAYTVLAVAAVGFFAVALRYHLL